jgi:parallel beta-helix repeat protein
MKGNQWLIALGLGLALALLWVLGGWSRPAVAAPCAGHIEAPEAPTADLTVCPVGPPTCIYTNVQAAVDAAVAGDVIKVATGVYTDASARAGVTQVVYISKTVTVRGGYTTAFTDPPDPDTNPTTLDAQKQGRVLYITGDISPTIEGLRITGGEGEPGGGVYVVNATVTLSGCQVTANTANISVPYGSCGGGVYLSYSPNATLSGNTIQDNMAHGFYGAYAGGVCLSGSPNATLSGNTIQGNHADIAGGVYLSGSPNATLSGNTILSNWAVSSHTLSEGGGVLLRDSDNVTLSGNTLRGNGGGYGGGVSVWDSDSVTLSGNTIQANYGNGLFGGHGGGVFLSGSNNVTLDNNVIADNQTQTTGSGAYVRTSTAHLLHTTIARNTGGDGSGLYVTDSAVALTNTVLVSHTVGITVTSGNTSTLNSILWCGNDANTGGPGTLTVIRQITGNPAFAADGYHITLASAALDAGVDAGVTVDIDGEPRPAGTHYDLGADELGYRRICLPLVVKSHPRILRVVPDWVSEEILSASEHMRASRQRCGLGRAVPPANCYR